MMNAEVLFPDTGCIKQRAFQGDGTAVLQKEPSKIVAVTGSHTVVKMRKNDEKRLQLLHMRIAK